MRKVEGKEDALHGWRVSKQGRDPHPTSAGHEDHIDAVGEFSGLASVGKLAGRTMASVENGLSHSDVTPAMEFMNLLTVTNDGVFDDHFIVDGTVNRVVHPTSI